MKSLLICTFLVLLSLNVFSDPLTVEERLNHYNINDDGLAMAGWDPISYFQGSPMRGKEALSFVYQGITYLFSSEKNRQTFEQNPDHYEPAYGGWCAWAMLEGEKVKTNPKRFKVVDGKLYLFYDRFFINTLKKWNTLAEEKTEAVLIGNADNYWRDILSRPLSN